MQQQARQIKRALLLFILAALNMNSRVSGFKLFGAPKHSGPRRAMGQLSKGAGTFCARSAGGGPRAVLTTAATFLAALSASTTAAAAAAGAGGGGAVGGPTPPLPPPLPLAVAPGGARRDDDGFHALRHRPKVFFVLGGPGAGKGTQCARLVARYGLRHLSAGDLLRAERASGSKDGQLIDEYIREGKIVPVEISLGLLKKAMEEAPENRFLIDGFPRNWDNVAGWDRVMGAAVDVDGVIFYDCPEAVLEERLLKRGETSGRTDDNIESARKRFKTYIESTLPVVQHYEAAGLVARIPGHCGGPDAVFERTRAAVEPALERELVALTRALLDAIDVGDWARYRALCADDLTALEPEAPGGALVRGLDFHKFYFDGAAAAAAATKSPPRRRRARSEVCSPSVRVLGTAAVVAYTRVVQWEDEDGQARSQATAETRVWELQEGVWRNVHFHRSAC